MKLEEVNEDLKLGDVVILKSGGESMTVTRIEEKKTGGGTGNDLSEKIWGYTHLYSCNYSPEPVNGK